jgi:hypothetical protein
MFLCDAMLCRRRADYSYIQSSSTTCVFVAANGQRTGDGGPTRPAPKHSSHGRPCCMHACDIDTHSDPCQRSQAGTCCCTSMNNYPAALRCTLPLQNYPISSPINPTPWAAGKPKIYASTHLASACPLAICRRQTAFPNPRPLAVHVARTGHSSRACVPTLGAQSDQQEKKQETESPSFLSR